MTYATCSLRTVIRSVKPTSYRISWGRRPVDRIDGLLPTDPRLPIPLALALGSERQDLDTRSRATHAALGRCELAPGAVSAPLMSQERAASRRGFLPQYSCGPCSYTNSPRRPDLLRSVSRSTLSPFAAICTRRGELYKNTACQGHGTASRVRAGEA